MTDKLPAKRTGDRPLSRAQAERLTERIRAAAEETWRLLGEAHAGRAWEPLGYPSWAAYVQTEFGMTDRNARYLLNQAEVIGELEAAAGVPLTAADVSARAARAVYPELPKLAGDVAGAVKGKRRETRPGIVQKVVDERKRASAPAPVVPAEQAQRERPEQTSGSAGDLAGRLSELPPLAWATVPTGRLRALRATIDALLADRGDTPADVADADRLARGVAAWAAAGEVSFHAAVDRVLARLTQVTDARRTPPPLPPVNLRADVEPRLKGERGRR